MRSKGKWLIAAAAALTAGMMFGAAPASAQPYGYGQHRGWHHPGYGGWHHSRPYFHGGWHGQHNGWRHHQGGGYRHHDRY